MEKANILVVDDQPSKLLSYEAILGELGFGGHKDNCSLLKTRMAADHLSDFKAVKFWHPYIHQHDGDVGPELETTIFRVVQECLTNIHRHSGSAVARVIVSRFNHELRVEVPGRRQGDLATQAVGNGNIRQGGSWNSGNARKNPSIGR